MLAALGMLLAALDPWVKGRAHCIAGKGSRDRAAMRRHHLTDGDLHEALRRQGCRAISEVECACLERNGEISVIARRKS